MDTNSLTPMLRQYMEIKKQHPGTLLFFRLGDFYELFNEDAVIASREMEITLTARQKESARPIPMCGVPHHAASNYIARLVKKGYRVAICEQTEEAGQSKLVRREVVRVITPGTAIEPQLIESRENVYLAAICGAGEKYGISLLEVSTGEFQTTQETGTNAWEKVLTILESFSPRELLFPESLQANVQSALGNKDTVNSLSDPSQSSNGNVVSISNNFKSNSPRIALTPLDDWLFQLDDCASLLKTHFKVANLDGYGLKNKNEAIRAAGACLRYAQDTQRAAANHISDINYFENNDFLVLDAVTLRNLDIVESRGESQKHCLFSVIDETINGMGARLLRSWLLRPSLKRSEIQTRLDAVTELNDSIFRDKIRYLLKEVADLGRLVGRLSLGTASARDLLALNRSLSQTPRINQTLSDASSLLLQVLSENIFEIPEIQDLISRSIADEPPMNLADGGTIRTGYSSELDELRATGDSVKQIIAKFEEAERTRSGIANLRVKFNNVLGYFIEVSKGNASRVPDDYERRQTLTNAERYTTPQLKEWEQNVLGAEERIKEIEIELFNQVRAEVAKETKKLQATARALATLDALQSLAEIASHRHYVCPTLHDGDEIEIKEGRHPVVEAFTQQPFVPNDLTMNNSTDRLLIITGPNMGGKSTILRQVALIQILAQIGSYVPAKAARLPILDRIWTRVGASDDLASGRSTFMVEMTETATILHNATPRSLILLDEIGRGTSTFDGLSIAWSVAEYLHNSPTHSAKTLFATHYHELTELAEKLPGAKNYQITAAEKDGEVVFLHKLAKGKASKSYGIAVARLAGLPSDVIARAGEVLQKLEKYELAVFNEQAAATSASKDSFDTAFNRSAKNKIASQISLFAISNESLIDELREINTENLTTEEAKDILFRLKARVI